MTARRKTITMTVTVSVPSWLTAMQARKEVRTLINESTVWGHVKPDGFDSIDHGDIKVRKVTA